MKSVDWILLGSAFIFTFLLMTESVKAAPNGDMGLIVVRDDRWAFKDSKTGEPFVPIGANYYDPDTGWAPQIWKLFDPERVERHFRQMQDMGFNVARVFIASVTFQPSPKQVSEEALKKLDTLIEIARRHRIRLILTGPDHWEGRPSYLDPDPFAWPWESMVRWGEPED